MKRIYLHEIVFTPWSRESVIKSVTVRIESENEFRVETISMGEEIIKFFDENLNVYQKKILDGYKND